MSRLHPALRDNSLSLFFALLFAVTIAAQTFAGHRASSAEQREHGGGELSWWDYVTSFDFWGAVGVMVVFTIYLRQRGSPESKPVESSDDETGAG